MALQNTIAIDVDRLDHSASLPDQSYDASVTSSAQTSQASVFSDSASVQSSAASSTEDDFRANDECTSSHIVITQEDKCPTWADVTSVPAAQRQHPRRCSLARNQKPPPLVRQDERKLSFVDNLVESATQMVEVIWPLSIAYCKVDTGAARGVLPLRTYIEETLRRSRTSYSTLQVALYYLVLIKAHVPTREQALAHSDNQSIRALMCGRRMFLAALILASKYLQDRNYSAKAWSKMSGLRVVEINSNERIFLEKINWKLHVAKPVFDQWTDIVLKYTPSSHPPSPNVFVPITWKALVPFLGPDLSTVPMPARPAQQSAMSDVVVAPLLSPVTPTPKGECYGRPAESAEDITPTPSTIAPPRFLEPSPRLLPPTPGLVRMGPLPTPQMTPSSVASSTPAVSACNSRRPSICSAMSIAQRFTANRCLNDEFPFPSMEKLRMASRRPSIASLASTRSSPESMITDQTRSSRASSISSVTTMSTTSACSAPRRCNLARLATTRNCRMPFVVSTEEPEGSASRPIAIVEESDEAEPDFSINERKLNTPHRHSKNAPNAGTHAVHHHLSVEKSRKRHRQSRGSKRSDLYDEVRYQLEDERADDPMIIDLVQSESDPEDITMTLPSPAAQHASSMLRNHQLQAKAYQPPAAITSSPIPSNRIPLSRHDGSKRACYSTVASSRGNALTANNNASLYMEIA